jgi:hypothetical protein
MTHTTDREYRLAVNRLVSAALGEAAVLSAEGASPRTELQREAVALARLSEPAQAAPGLYVGERLPLGTVVLRRGGRRWRTVVGGDTREVVRLVLEDVTGTAVGDVLIDRFAWTYARELGAAGFALPAAELREWVEVQQ